MATLPFLPGYSTAQNSNVGKVHFPKKHFLEVANNVTLLNDKSDNDPGKQFTTFPPGEGPALPAWVAFDKQALSFIAYWQEGISELRHETYRVHKVKIFFFLEDDSVQIVNCRPLVNSGLVEGSIHRYILIKRHRIRMPPPNDECFYNLEHFKVGEDITIYGKVFHITGCGDKFTENFLTRMGFIIPKPEIVPPDPGTEYVLKSRQSELMPLRPHVKTCKLRQFLDHDREVLRFYGYWDDTDSLYGDLREIVLLFYIADDSMEIREIIKPNSGRDNFSVLIRKRKMPKKWPVGLVPGMTDDFTLLNVLGSTTEYSRYSIQDKLQSGVFPLVDYYKDSDLMIGSVINVLGRKIILCDCDEFTKHYYQTKFSIYDFRPIVPEQVEKASQKNRFIDIPPHDGFGSEEDSLAGVYKLVPKKPLQNFMNFIKLDRSKDESNILRFSAVFANNTLLTSGRKFVINIFLLDDKIMVYELPQRNSGFAGGKFIRKLKIKKGIIPNPPKGENSSHYYNASDFFLGAVIKLNNFEFLIVDADEYCLKHMEDHPDQFPQASIEHIIKKIKNSLQDKARLHELKEALVNSDPERSGKLEYSIFKYTVMRFVDERLLCEHEYVTLARHYSKNLMMDLFSIEALTAVAQKELARQGFDGFDELYILISHYDMSRKGTLDRKNLYRALRSYPLPLSPDLLQMLVEKLEPSEENDIDYKYLVNLLNYKKFPSNYRMEPHIAFDTIRLEMQPKTGPVHHLVEYKDFLFDVEKGVDEKEA